MLNEIQQNFLREFKQNIEQCKNNFFILNGPAGSGKTRLIKESVEICLENGKNKGYVSEKHLSKDFNPPETIISNSKYFLNVPYLWGGKSYQE